MNYTHRDISGMRWRFEGNRPVSALADKIMLEAGLTRPASDNNQPPGFKRKLLPKYKQQLKKILLSMKDVPSARDISNIPWRPASSWWTRNAPDNQVFSVRSYDNKLFLFRIK